MMKPNSGASDPPTSTMEERSNNNNNNHNIQDMVEESAYEASTLLHSKDKPTVTWADDDTSSTTLGAATTTSSTTNPLRNSNFQEEGSSTAAVIDANINLGCMCDTYTLGTGILMPATTTTTINRINSTSTTTQTTQTSYNHSGKSASLTLSPLLSTPVATSTATIISQATLSDSPLPLVSPDSLKSQSTDKQDKVEDMGTHVNIAPPSPVTPTATEVSKAIIIQEDSEVPSLVGPSVATITEAEDAASMSTPMTHAESFGDYSNADGSHWNAKGEEADDHVDPSPAIALSPAWSQSTHDARVFVSPSASTDEEGEGAHYEVDDDDDDEVVLMTPSKSDVEHGIILPPSLSAVSATSSTDRAATQAPYVISPSFSSESYDSANPAIFTSPSLQSYLASPARSDQTTTFSAGNYVLTRPNTATTAAYEKAPDVAFELTLLPMDALHCIASFLTPLEWSKYGQTCKAASKVCREIFGRVRMHGFRCATEVITAWKLGQLADARELAALYISTGVPIYPRSLGHSYHTMVWRMGIEAKKLQDELEKKSGNSDNDDEATRSTDLVDSFYSERTGRGRDALNPLCSYLEDKSMFLLGPDHPYAHAANSMTTRWGSTVSLHSSREQHREQQLAPAVADLENLAQHAPVRSAPVMRRSHSLALPSAPTRRVTQSEMIALSKAPRVVVPCHRHLLDQHLLGRSCVDDEFGELKTPPVSLSVDFFHPHLLSHCMSNAHSRILKEQPMQAPTAIAAPAETSSFEGNLQEDPNFQAWATRAASLVHNGMNGTTTPDDEEELAELQDMYSQMFAADRNGSDPANPTNAVNTMQPTPTEQSLAVAPQQEPGPPRDPVASASLESRLLSTVLPRDGYNSILNSVDLDVYSVSANSKDKPDRAELIRQLRARFTFYQRRLEMLLSHGDSAGHEECMLDLWDEFFPVTAKVHYHDRHTAVPRTNNGLQQFLMQPCPKELGIIQCEIERVKISSKKKGVMKGRLFPTYEYRLFIKDRDHSEPNEDSDEDKEESNGGRRDTLLMVAKNRGRKHVETSGVVSLTPAAKKGANNYYLYTPQQSDVDTHFIEVNKFTEEEFRTIGNPNGASIAPSSPKKDISSQMLLGRLQSNFIGTEFQIYTPKLRKKLPGKDLIRRCASMNEEVTSFVDPDEDSGFTSDSGPASRRRSRFGRLSLRRNSSTVSSVPAHNSGTRSRTKRRAIASLTDEATVPSKGEESWPDSFFCEEEDGVITYTANLLGSRPRIMDVCIPKLPKEGNSGSVWSKYVEKNEDDDDDVAPYNRMLSRFKELQQRLNNMETEENDESHEVDGVRAAEDFGLMALQNRPPWWNNELGSFVLNFRGRVSVASVKNFQLCDRNDHDHIMLQFGRIEGRHSFTMDYQYPLTAVQAFSIAISSLQSKISFG